MLCFLEWAVLKRGRAAGKLAEIKLSNTLAKSFDLNALRR
jgi:hypothetical protein